jgi:hypothetical protein
MTLGGPTRNKFLIDGKGLGGVAKGKGRLVTIICTREEELGRIASNDQH